MSNYRNPNDIARLKLYDKVIESAEELILAYNEHYGSELVIAESQKFSDAVEKLHQFDNALAKIEADKQPDLPFDQGCDGECGCDAPCDYCAANHQ